MKCVSYTRTIPWKNHKGELTIADQNQRIAEYLAEHKELNLQKRYTQKKMTFFFDPDGLPLELHE